MGCDEEEKQPNGPESRVGGGPSHYGSQRGTRSVVVSRRSSPLSAYHRPTRQSPYTPVSMVVAGLHPVDMLLDLASSSEEVNATQDSGFAGRLSSAFDDEAWGPRNHNRVAGGSSDVWDGDEAGNEQDATTEEEDCRDALSGMAMTAVPGGASSQGGCPGSRRSQVDEDRELAFELAAIESRASRQLALEQQAQDLELAHQMLAAPSSGSDEEYVPEEDGMEKDVRGMVRRIKARSYAKKHPATKAQPQEIE